MGITISKGVNESLLGLYLAGGCDKTSICVKDLPVLGVKLIDLQADGQDYDGKRG